MAISQRTVEEASKYIQDSIGDWKNTGQDKKIISLSNWAEKWRSNTGGPTAKIKSLQKSIKGLELIIKRNKKIDIESPNLGNSLKALKSRYDELVAKFGEPKTKIKEIPTELPKVE